ncbi:hypothetical protein ABFB09_00015 [Dehalogenimonas sp. THU2]|uniref:hypothetical protein n=1 Tax=Dehalogenimonas sp. THU2 TaxID=3151121 RepID=UPI0032189256
MMQSKQRQSGFPPALAEARKPAALLSRPPGQLDFYALPMAGGVQMPLPGFPGSTSDDDGRAAALDWHCYLGSR